ncbi:MAG: hypothetical protein HZA90_24965 [Verrucomicrobia bacterium]|nr:hypothetical protein [Verrucomicrobiota bacterium]
MKQEHESGLEPSAAATAPTPARWWIKAIALVVIGMVIGASGYRGWGQWQGQQRLKQARAKAETLFASLVPKAEMQLGLLGKQLEDLETDLGEASLAKTSAEIQLGHFRVQHKRAFSQLEQAQQALRRLEAGLRHGNRPSSDGTEAEVLSEDQQERLGDLTTQLEQVRANLNALGTAIEVTKERRQQLAAVEAETSRRAATEPEPARRESSEPIQRVSGEAPAQPSLAAAPMPALQRLPTDLWPVASVPAVQQIQVMAPPQPIVLTPPAISYVNEPLVIGSSYPDRFLGYRDYLRYRAYPARYPYYRYVGHHHYIGRRPGCW